MRRTLDVHREGRLGGRLLDGFLGIADQHLAADLEVLGGLIITAAAFVFRLALRIDRHLEAARRLDRNDDLVGIHGGLILEVVVNPAHHRRVARHGAGLARKREIKDETHEADEILVVASHLDGDLLAGLERLRAHRGDRFEFRDDLGLLLALRLGLDGHDGGIVLGELAVLVLLRADLELVLLGIEGADGLVGRHHRLAEPLLHLRVGILAQRGEPNHVDMGGSLGRAVLAQREALAGLADLSSHRRRRELMRRAHVLLKVVIHCYSHLY